MPATPHPRASAPAGIAGGGAASLGLPLELSDFLSADGAHILFLHGPPGSGKSALSSELLGHLDGNLVLVTPAGGTTDPRFLRLIQEVSSERLAHLRMPNHGVGDPGSQDRLPGSLFAMAPGPHGSGEDPTAWVSEVQARLSRERHSYVVIDPWADPGPSGGGGAEAARSPRSTALEALRAAIQGTPSHLILVSESPLAQNQASTMDGVIETSYANLPVGRLRLLSIRKLRGVTISTSEHPYTLTGGRFRCPPLVPVAGRPKGGPPDPAPTARPGMLWPGSEAFARVFGWLRLGSMTALEVGDAVPDYVATTLLTPLVAQAIHGGGRVVWVTSPTALPEDYLELLLQWLPREEIAAGLRILSAGGGDDEPLLKRVLLDLPLAPGSAPSPGTGTATRVAPSFTDGVRFLEGTPEGGAAVFVLSFEGLRAVAAVTGVKYDPATFPLIVARYLRIPRFHGIGITRSADQLGSTVRGSTEMVIRADAKFGRIFLTGIRPETLPQALTWDPADGRYQLVEMS